MKKTMIRMSLLAVAILLFINNANAQNDREYWVEAMIKIVEPIYENLSKSELRKNMPVETNDGLNTGKRKDVTHLEAFGRSFCGIAPWLNLGADNTKEGKLRAKYIDLTVKSIANAVNPKSPDYMPFDGPGAQPLVDAAFLAQGLIRSKDQIWPKLSDVTKEQLLNEMRASRKIQPFQMNWLLFSAIIEAALLEFTGECDMKPLKHAINKHKEWYKGDGWYGDGASFHLDYYNSYVIQPMLLDILKIMKSNNLDEDHFYDVQEKRFTRHAHQQEMMISPEGTYPMLGRSMGYRFGCFQVLAQAALEDILPNKISKGQVRCALTAVIKRQISAPNTFDGDGWLKLGFYGHQPDIAEGYISTGSSYLCTFVFLPLGLDSKADFWTAPAEQWSSQKIWSGQPVTRDYSIRD